MLWAIRGVANLWCFLCGVSDFAAAKADGEKKNRAKIIYKSSALPFQKAVIEGFYIVYKWNGQSYWNSGVLFE